MQIASAVDMIVQVSRMRDGSRRITHISEITGMEGDVITMQDLFTAEVEGEGIDGKLKVNFINHGLRPALTEGAIFQPRAPAAGGHCAEMSKGINKRLDRVSGKLPELTKSKGRNAERAAQ